MNPSAGFSINALPEGLNIILSKAFRLIFGVKKQLIKTGFRRDK